MILFALGMIVILGMMAIALDGSYGFVQNRRAQNATDFAAFAGAQELFNSSLCNGAGAAPSTTQMANIVTDIVNANSGSVGSSWQGQFLDNTGTKITGTGSTFTTSTNSGYPPPGSCGLIVNTTAAFTWPSFMAGIIGQSTVPGFASAAVGNLAKGNAVSIASLNKVGPHTILGGGTGKFVVSGDIFLNTKVQNQPWSQSANGYVYDDAIDAKVGSKLTVYGTVHSTNDTYPGPVGAWVGQSLWPLDWCFDGSGLTNDPTSPTAYVAGDPPPYPHNKPDCSVGGGGKVDLSYNQITPTLTPINDPLQGSGSPLDPFTNPIACPGAAQQTDPAIPGAGGTMKPGIYNNAVKITTAMTFGDCSALGGGEGAYPGIYRFMKGLWITPSAGAAVTGSNVVLTTKTAYPVAGNVPGGSSPSGVGNGAPCLPNPTNGQNGAESDYTAPSICSGTSSPTLYGATIGGGVYGTGDNFSVMIGGAATSTVNLTGPTTGAYAGTNSTPGVVLYQDHATPGNYGFDARTGDAAAITITGVVYDASLSSYGIGSPFYYWDPGNGIPAYPGGTLQTGYGAGWSTPAPSTGSVTITGTTVVDAFNTDGGTTITIIGKPYTVPGGGTLSLLG
jgi:Putative Flp pilus-assembly TadE/G-like